MEGDHLIPFLPEERLGEDSRLRIDAVGCHRYHGSFFSDCAAFVHHGTDSMRCLAEDMPHEPIETKEVCHRVEHDNIFCFYKLSYIPRRHGRHDQLWETERKGTHDMGDHCCACSTAQADHTVELAFLQETVCNDDPALLHHLDRAGAIFVLNQFLKVIPCGFCQVFVCDIRVYGRPA